MSHTIQVLCLSSQTSPARLWSERGKYRFSGFEDCSGINMVWMTNKAEFLTRSTQFGLSMVTVMV